MERVVYEQRVQDVNVAVGRAPAKAEQEERQREGNGHGEGTCSDLPTGSPLATDEQPGVAVETGTAHGPARLEAATPGKQGRTTVSRNRVPGPRKKRVMNKKRDHGDLPQVFNAALRLLLALTLFTPTTFFEKAARAAAALIAESASPDGAVDMAASK